MNNAKNNRWNEERITGLRRITSALRALEAAESDADIRATLRVVRRLKKEFGGAFAEEWAEAHRRDAAEVG